MSVAVPHQARWDIFCKVVDNYGDIGVCWRLARQLAREYDLVVRLWVDDLASFARLECTLDVGRASQWLGAVEVCHWSDAAAVTDSAAAQVLIEAFGCGLPDALLAQLAERPAPPVWINLEYLSAETWVDGCHGMASPQSGSALVRHFYFPGFTPATGGVLAERDLLAQRQAFADDPAAQAAWAARLGLPVRQPGERRITLFGYPGAPLEPLLAAWASGTVPTTVLVPEGVFAAQAAPYEGTHGALRLHRFAFVPQDDYDRLLWASDFNFVRGEDSFVRALWAGQPFAWHIYRQEEGAHRRKLDAFLDRYGATLSSPAAAALRGFWQAWNDQSGHSAIVPAWDALVPFWPVLRQHAAGWAGEVLATGDLATQLVAFAASKVGGAGRP